MARGRRTDPTAAVLAGVMHEMGFEVTLISQITGLPRGTVGDIAHGHGPWNQMPHNELFEITRLRLIKAIDDSVYDLGMKAMAKLEERMKTASFTELMGIVDVALNKGESWR